MSKKAESVRYCPSCGHELSPDDLYCVECGHSTELPDYVVQPRRKRSRRSKGWGTVVFVLIVALAVIAGAVMLGLREEDEEVMWAKCQQTTELALLQEYLDRYPDGKHRAEVKKRYALLVKEDSQWQQASYGNDEYQLRSFLSNYPNGRYSAEAKEKLDNLVWEKAKAKNTAEAVEEYMSEFTGGLHYKEAQELLGRLQADSVPEEVQNRIVATINTFLSGMENWDVAQMKCVCADHLDNFMDKSGGLEVVDEYFRGMKESDVDTIRYSKLANVKISKLEVDGKLSYNVSFDVNRSLGRKQKEKGTFAKMNGKAVVNEEYLFTTLNLRKEPTLSGEGNADN